jgi:hypothetical protein
MTTRISASGVLSAAIAALLSAALPASPPDGAQASPRPAVRKPGPPWTAPRTPWGDPDLQGVFTNTNEYMTPLERPDTFAGKRLEDISPDELARMRASAEREMVAALPGGRVRGPDDWWLQNLDVSKRNQVWLIVDPPDGRVPALTPEGRTRAGQRVRSSFVGGPFDGPEDLNLLERCISRSIPGSMIPVMYGNNYQIVQAPGYVAITYEIVHETRIIPLDRRPRLGDAISQHMGEPRGHWEGDTLVVVTTNFKAASAYRTSNGPTLRVTERFRRVAPDRIEWTATMEDPQTWTRPWTIALPLTSDSDPVLPFDCHEHNYGLINILRGARSAER